MGFIQNIIPRLISLPFLLISIILHEIAHGLVAYWQGDKTAKDAGRLTLNPIKHIDPIGALCMIFAPFGWAKPVPINPFRMKKPKLGMVLCSIAGPLCNLLLAFVATLIYVPVFEATGGAELVVEAFGYFISLNCVLAVFNLIPFPPLDGSKVLFAVLPERTYFRYMQYEKYGIIILLILVYFGAFTSYINVVASYIFGFFLEIALLIF